MLANVNGAASEQMGHQLLDVALGKPAALATERKAEPIAKEKRTKFVGAYDLAPLSLTIA